MRKLSDETIHELILQYENGKTVQELANTFGVDRHIVVKYLKANNVFKPKTHNWTPEMEEKLKEIYPTGDWDLIYRTFPNVKKQSIHLKASALGLHAKEYFWSEQDKNILIEYYGTLSAKEIQPMLSKEYSIRTIQSQAKKMNLTKSRIWTDEELQLLNDNYSNIGSAGIAELLPHKTRDAIRGKARALGLQSNCYWSEEETQYLIDNWKTKNDIELAIYLGRGVKGVADKRRDLGLYYLSHDKHGYEDLDKYIRMNIVDWKKRSMDACEYKCVLTGEKFDVIHHIHGVNLILQETLDMLNIGIRDSIEDYSQNELESILHTFLLIQDKYPLGVCLSENVHKLFHSIYGYGNNTEEQWNEFEQNYKNGIYNTSIIN